MDSKATVGDKVRITNVSIEAGDYAKNKSGADGTVVAVDDTYFYVDFGDGNYGWKAPNNMSGYPFFESELTQVDE